MDNDALESVKTLFFPSRANEILSFKQITLWNFISSFVSFLRFKDARNKRWKIRKRVAVERAGLLKQKVLCDFILTSRLECLALIIYSLFLCTALRKKKLLRNCITMALKDTWNFSSDSLRCSAERKYTKTSNSSDKRLVKKFNQEPQSERRIESSR